MWSKDFAGSIGSDESKAFGVVDWVTTDKPGVYVLSGQASEKGGRLHAENSTFIKVTPKLFSRPVRLLLIGEKKYSTPIAQMTQAMGLNVDVIAEESIQRLAGLRDPREIRKKYDLVWLASFDSLWKFLDDQAAGGLEQAVQQGVGFIHTGGPGSFHGGSGMGACLDFTSLAEALPVALRSRNDLVYAQGLVPTAVHGSASIKEIRAEAGAGRGWSERQLREYGLPGFNDVELKPGSEQVLSIAGRPLLVTGQYGAGAHGSFHGLHAGLRGEARRLGSESVVPLPAGPGVDIEPGKPGLL